MATSPAHGEHAPPAPVPPLTPVDAALLLTLLDTPGSVAHAATSRGITAEKFLALIANPGARQAIEDVRAFAAARREIRADADREEFTAVLREVAKASPDLVEKRRAATAGLRALDRAVDKGGMAAARRSHGSVYTRPWREIRIPRPARSPWESGATACPATTTATRSSTPTAGKSETRRGGPCDESSTPDLAGRTPNGHAPRNGHASPSLGVAVATSPTVQVPSRGAASAKGEGASSPTASSAPHDQSNAPDASSRAHALTCSRAHSSPPLPSALPSPSYTALMAADIQLAALRTNEIPEPDSGIATVHGFFPPEIGDYALFAERYRDGLRSLLAPQDVYTLTVLREDRDRALVRAALVSADQTRPAPTPAILFHLARTESGDPAGPCWLNTAIQFCDSG